MTLHSRPPVPAIRECFAVDFDTGQLFWRARPAKQFHSVAAQRTFNTRYAGAEAFTSKTNSAYHHGQVTLAGRRYWLLRSHVIWALRHGRWPDLHLGHRNEDLSDDRPGNLREQTEAEQSAFSRNRATTRSGARGVIFRRGRYEARIKAHGTLLFVGAYSSLDVAVSARNAAAVEHYGEFARLV
jgi:hypothetical protein